MSSLCGADDRREALAEDRDDRGGVVDRQRRLRDVGELLRRVRLEGAGVGLGLDQRDRARRQLAHGADHLRMAGMADQHDLAALAEVELGLAVHLGDQRAGGVEMEEVAAAAPPPAPPWRRHGPRRPPAGRSPGSRRAPRRRPRPSPSGRRRRSGCGRSRGAHRPARRTSRAPARRSGWRGRRRRRSRAGCRAGCRGAAWRVIGPRAWNGATAVNSRRQSCRTVNSQADSTSR